MDNFVEIIGLLLFILFNFLLGMNEKKKKKTKKDHPTELENIKADNFDLYKPDSDIPQKKRVVSKKTFDYSQKNSDTESPEVQNYTNREMTNNKRKVLLTSLKNKNNLKTAFLLSEILSEPKAFKE